MGSAGPDSGAKVKDRCPAPRPSDGFIFGLATNPLFQAGAGGLADNNPLATFQTGLATQAQQQARAREEAKIRRFGIELAKVAMQSGDPTMQRLVALGPEGYRGALARLNELAAAQRGDRLFPEGVNGLPNLTEGGELLSLDRSPQRLVELVPQTDRPPTENSGLGLRSAPFLSDPSPDARPSVRAGQDTAERRARTAVDESNLNDPLLGAMTRAQAMQFAEEIAGMPVPDYKRDFIPPFQFARWGAALDKAGVTGHARRAFMETFAAEDGLRRDDENGAVAGIRPGTLALVGPRLGIPDGTRPEDLTNQQRTQVYREFMNLRRNLGRVGGIESLDQLRDEEVAAALVDTLFRNGNAGGARAIQNAINSVESDRVTVDSSFGQEIFDALRDLTNDCNTRQRLLDRLAEERRLQFPGELPRFNHFRFLNSEECG